MTSLLTTVAPVDLPSLSLAERRALPDTGAIYFVLAGDTVLYGGQSVSLRQRWTVSLGLSRWTV